METQLTVHAIAELSRMEELAPEKGYFLTYYRDEIIHALQEQGYAHIDTTESADDEARPDLLAMRDGQYVCLCLPPIPASLMELQALSAEQCAYCERHYPQHEVHYAALITDPQEARLYLLGPVAVRANESWQAQELDQAQFLPFSRRAVIDRYSPIFGGAALFKLSSLIIPHTLQHGQLPRFSIEGLFADQEQDTNAIFALMGSAPPSFFMLMERNTESGTLDFLRPFFFYGDRPHAELELTRSADTPQGAVELLDKTGRVLCAECLEATLFPTLLTAGKRYRWTLSVVADRCRPIKRDFTLTSGPVFEQARREYLRTHTQEPPADFSVRVSTENIRTFLQKPRHSYAELCGRVTHVEELQVDSRRALLISLLPVQDNDDVEVQVFVGETAGLSAPPSPGDVIECAGFTYASPDAVAPAEESWQDSGEIAALQEEREHRANALRAYDRYAAYSLAYGVVASAFARAGYSLLSVPICHTREEATFAAQDAEGRRCLIFADAVLADAEHTFLFSEEQRSSILIRERSAGGTDLSAVHCSVRLQREPGSENYAVQLFMDPACPAVDPAHIICEATQCPRPGPALTEEDACRLIGSAICSQEWGDFARAAAEDLTYSSLVNGTKTTGKVEYIRYMAERKQLWVEQMGWAGMRIETGSISYRGERRPCFAIHCYGRMIGAAVVSLRSGFIAAIETVPLEVNTTFTPAPECRAPRSYYHPLTGHLIPFTSSQSPLQRFASAYLQECMVRKTGYISPAEELRDSAPPADGVQFSLQKKGARWLKIVRNGPTFCDLAFSYGGRVYAVCAIESEQHPALGGDTAAIVSGLPELQQLLDMSARYGLTPCVFPAKRDHAPDPRSSWNLWDARTLQPIHPEQLPDTPSAPPSDWEVLNASLSELVTMVERSGGRVIGCHDVPELLPHFWFYDVRGRLSWVIVRTHPRGSHTDRPFSEAELQAAQRTPEAQGYVMDAEAWGNSAHTAAACAGAPLYLRLSEPQPIRP